MYEYRNLADIIGKNGACIRTIQEHTRVKVNIPADDGSAKRKIKLAGTREAIAQAKSIIKEIMEFYHHPITHPGIVHTELEVPERMYNIIIGAKGSEIRHIQNNFKVNVHIPSQDSLNKNVLIVGASTGVEGAKKYIMKIVQQTTAQESDAAVTAGVWNEQKADEDDKGDEWTQQYMYNRNRTQGTVADAAGRAIDAQTSAWTSAVSGW